MIKINTIQRLILIIGVLFLVSCKSNSKLVSSVPTINSKASLKKPYLILISLDGFRWDYVDKYAPPNISNFIKNGVKSASLIPSFPSKTFPNHYTIATGMYPDKHGIIGNSFYSHKNDAFYKIRDRKMVTDGSFYEGSPIWVQADKEKMVSASYFFVGSEANIQGRKPTYYYEYDGSVKNETRVTQALNWLAMPKKERPHMISLYFSDMDDVGHKYGPENESEIKKALFKLDTNLGNLFKGVKATGLPVNIMIVSDHGMTTVSNKNYISIEKVTNNSLYTVINNGAIVNILPKKDVSIDSIIQFLKTKEDNFKVYKTENTPGFEYTPKNKDWGAVQVIPDFGYYFLAPKAISSKLKMTNTTSGVHGYDPKYKDMHGIFYANGPAFKKDYVTSSLKNIHLYPIMCKILGLKTPSNIDGDLNQIKDVLKSDK
jgi:predicted AlkP superfamily pyrophosphatase or phosphodiesterase